VLGAIALFASGDALSQYPAPLNGWQNNPWSQPTNNQWGSSQWVNSPNSVWTTPDSSSTNSNTGSRPPSQTLAGRSPSEQLQITKCRSGQSCDKCRQLNCFWDATAKITNRCIALGLESSSTSPSVDQGTASNLAQCPVTGQAGSIGVNWLAIEASGAQVPRLDGMSDSAIQGWLSGLPNYRPDASDVNYPAGSAFRELLPNAATAANAGQIPSATPWVSFWDALNGGYGYDDSGYSGYDSGYPSGGYPGAYPSGGYPGAYPSGGYPGAYPSSGYPGAYPSGGYPGAYPSGGYGGMYPQYPYDNGFGGPINAPMPIPVPVAAPLNQNFGTPLNSPYPAPLPSINNFGFQGYNAFNGQY